MDQETINPTVAAETTDETPGHEQTTAGTGTASADDTPAGEQHQQSTTDTDGGDKQAAQKSDEPQKRKTSGFQKRIKKLVAQKHELEERLKRAEAELAALKEPPREDDFETIEEFVAAQAEHIAEKKLLEREAQQAKQQVENLDTEALQSKREAYDEVVRDGIQRHPDFFQKVTTCPLPEHVADAALDTPDAAETLYYIGNNPLVALELAKLPPEQAAARVEEIGNQLATTTATTTNAPPPISEPGSGATQGAPEPLRDDLPMDEWVRRREAQLRQRGGM